MRKLVFFDLDGTIVSHRTNPSHIPALTLDALRRLEAAGHTVALATARGLGTARKYLGELRMHNAVLCNGAHILLGGNTVHLEYIDGAYTREVVRRLLSLPDTVFAADGDCIYAHNATEDNLAYLREQAGGDGYVKPLSALTNACKLDIYGSFRPEPSDTVEVLAGEGSTDIRPAGVSKERGIARFAALSGFDMAETVAVGDGANDAGMLRAAGTGIAVGGADAEALAAADIVAGTIEEGGVFNALRQLGLI